jgi:3-hydroxyisobutyrate dehydrogenase-like beta-hydroxyacid dehydrogenase
MTGNADRPLGLVGLGNMGGAIAARLLGSRSPLHVFDLDNERVSSFRQAGANAAASLSDLSSTCPTVLICLPTSQHVEDVIFSEGGLLAEMKRESLVIDLTSGDPRVSRRISDRLAEFGIYYLDAPVSGGPQAARAGTLAIIVGGPSEILESARPVLELISPNIRRVGGVGAGHTVKLLNNVLAAAHRMIAFEALVTAQANGIEPSTFTDVVNISSGRSYATEVTIPRHVLSGELSQGFSLGLMTKDVTLGSELVPPGMGPLSLVVEVAARLRDLRDELGPGADINEILWAYEGAATGANDG